MDAAAEELADRVRALLETGGDVEEKRMFGTRAFLVRGHILVGVRTGGVLLVRVAESTGEGLLGREGVATAVMGTRTMGTGWLDVSPAALSGDQELMDWIDIAREDAEQRP